MYKFRTAVNLATAGATDSAPATIGAIICGGILSDARH